MADQFIEAFIDKLILLEKRAGANVQYRVMPPLTVPFHDNIAIQNVAKQIAVFIGLTGYTFIIATVKQKEKVGGNIDLSTGGKEVFVEVDTNMMKFPDAVAATLCHEVCHKWLQVNGIQSHIKLENEILTDITTIFLGFGKIMLNGCRTKHIKHEAIPDGTRTTTETMTAGYLDRAQLAVVYRLVCAMRGIPPADFMQGLNADAISAVKICDSTWGHHYNPRYHRTETVQETVTAFKKQTAAVQYAMADLDKYVTYAKKSFCETIDDFLNAGHKKLESLHEKAEAMTKGGAEPDLALRFLQTIKMEFKVGRLSCEVQTVSQQTERFLHHAKAVGRHLFKTIDCFPSPSPTMFNVVTCPKDGTKLRLPENSGDLIATCPVCKYRFAYNTSAVSFQAPSRKLTWWQRIRNLVRR